ncbi:hypothetical protein J7M22_16620 [Candidatus Poribacteria bacterium]|nr:hypothetical protein [Candidatus Poribacteria bacterium]
MRGYLRRRGIKASIPKRRMRGKGRRGRPYRFVMEVYLKGRCGVDRFFGWRFIIPGVCFVRFIFDRLEIFANEFFVCYT